jgi:hypothetical protein
VLRCGRCERPICSRDAKLTPVGYRCRDCLRGQQAVFYTGTRLDYVLAGVVTLPLATIGAQIVPGLGWFVIFGAPLAGGAIAEVVRWVVRRRRSRYLWLAACGALVLGTALGLVWSVAPELDLGFDGDALLNLVWPAVYLGLATSTIYARLRF